MTILRTCLQILKRVPHRYRWALLAFMLAAALTDGVGILLLVPLLETLQHSSGSGSMLIKNLGRLLGFVGVTPGFADLLVLFILLVALRSAIQYCRDRLSSAVQYLAVDDLRLRCFSSLLAAEWRWMTRTRQSDHANQLITDINRVGVGLNQGLGLLVTIFTAVAYLAAAFLLSWKITLLAVVSGGILFALLAGQRRQALKLGEGLGEANRMLHGGVQESLAGMKLSKILGNEQRYLDVLTRRITKLRRQQQHFVANTSLSKSLFQVAGAVLLALYVYLGSQIWSTPLAQLLTLVLIFSRMIPLFMQGLQQLHHWLHALPALQQTRQLLEQCEANAEPAAGEDDTVLPLEYSVALARITVCYEGREQAALSDLSLEFPVRTTTAIMGESGAGKSTLADVLTGLLVPDAGQLLVDDVPVEGGDRRRWRRSVAYVPQDSFLFNDTIRNNLLWGRPGATDEELREALQLAAAEFVLALPKGLDTEVGDAGGRLSGGERQRLALARTLLKKPSLLILDEATSALDVENEMRIREAIQNLHGNLTVVIIGHRLPTLEHADRVVMLSGGKVRVAGSWQDVRTHLTLGDMLTP